MTAVIDRPLEIAPDIDFDIDVTQDTKEVPLDNNGTSTEKGKSAHIVKTKPRENAAGKVLEARVMGFPVEALCGHKWVPSRDPKQLPICQACKDIYEKMREHNSDLNERPAE